MPLRTSTTDTPVPLLPLQAQGAARQPANASSGPAGASSYTPFAFAAPTVYLDVSIAPGATRVTSVVDYVPLHSSSSRPCQQLQLRGEDLELVELCLDGERSRTEAG